MAAYFRRTWIGWFAFAPYLARIERQLHGQGTGRKSPAHVRADLERQLDAIEGLLADHEYLLGTGPYLCDFALRSQLEYLTLAPATREVLRDRCALKRYVARMPGVCM